MITAYQAAILRAATHIDKAADEVRSAIPLICLDQSDRDRLHKVLSELHDLFGGLIPNTLSTLQGDEDGTRT